MSGHPEAMSQDEDNTGTHMISLSEAQGGGESMYIVHQVNPLKDNLDQVHLASDQNEEQQVIEMDEFIQMKRQKQKGGGKKIKALQIKQEVVDIDFTLSGGKNNKKNFSDSWLLSNAFKHWLQRHPNSNTKAICKVCNKVLLAGKSELLKHGASKKHQKFVQASRGWKKSEPEDYNENSGDGSSDAGNGFQNEWLEDPLYKDWIATHPDSMYKALCRICNKVLLAIKSDLMKHRSQKKHRDNMNSSSFAPDDSYDNSGAMEFYDDTELTEETMAQENEYTLEEETETHTEDALETPIRVYRVKPTSSATPAPATRVSTAVSGPVQDCETAQAIVTQLAPHWKGKAVINGHVQEMKLSDYRGRYLVMFFYPQDFATVCSTEILALCDVISAFRVVNCEVIAVSVDSHLAHLAWTKTLTSSHSSESKTIVPLLSDSTHSISKTYGCYHQSAGHSLRAYYIIDKRGVLRAMNISDVQVGRNLKEILRLVEAFQLVDTTNTQCPVNWTSGQPSVKVAL